MEVGRVQGHVDGLGAGKDGVGDVVFVERREHNHAIAGIAGGHHCRHHGFGTATSDHDVRVRVDGQAGEPGLLARQRLTEVGRAPGHRVLMGSVSAAVLSRLLEHLRRVEIRKALRQVDRPVRIGQPGHVANDRLGEACDATTGLRHV